MLPTNLTANHLLVIELLNNFYQEYNILPSTRALINYAANKNSKLKLDSILFFELFPNGIAQACEIAGLPKSPRCL
jgi:TusE/DsrC/DsvC family sulfur relay protein